MKTFTTLIILNFFFVSCDFIGNNTSMSSWGKDGDSNQTDYVDTVLPDEDDASSGDGSSSGDNENDGISESEEDGAQCDHDHSLFNMCKGMNIWEPMLFNNLYAIRAQYINRSNESSIKSILGAKKLIHIDKTFSESIEVEPRSYAEGVAGREGEFIYDPRTGGELLEDYIQHIRGQIIVQDEEAEGEYEFATLSDDGVFLRVGVKKMIESSKLHSPKVHCSKRSVTIEKNKPINLRHYYHQGPKNNVANMLFWRKKVEGNTYENCGKYTRSYQAMINEGWDIVPPSVLFHQKSVCSRSNLLRLWRKVHQLDKKAPTPSYEVILKIINQE